MNKILVNGQKITSLLAILFYILLILSTRYTSSTMSTHSIIPSSSVGLLLATFDGYFFACFLLLL
uniref:Uncharacterized protein n=1 Tax=Lepeophtheirus salmonis TaxID=72036 RepID=A0A0K2ULF8_LEPSM